MCQLSTLRAPNGERRRTVAESPSRPPSGAELVAQRAQLLAQRRHLCLEPVDAGGDAVAATARGSGAGGRRLGGAAAAGSPASPSPTKCA